MNERFTDRVVWIVNAGEPVGQELAKAFAAEGAKLVLSGVETAPEGLEAKCYPVPVDDDIARATVKENEDIDTLVFVQPDSPDMNIENCTADFWDEQMAVGLNANFCACRAVMRVMGPRAKGTFLSIVSHHCEKPSACKLMLSVCASGNEMLMREAAQDYGRLEGLFRCNTLAVGPVEGDEERFEGSMTHSYYTIATKVPRVTLGQLSEIVDPALYLCSDEASYVNGAMLRVDGGLAGYYFDGDSKVRFEQGYAGWTRCPHHRRR